MKTRSAKTVASRAGSCMSAGPEVAITQVAWLPQTQIGMHQWCEQGRRLGILGRSAAWWIGDWLLYGNVRFGERYVRASKITGYDTQTLMNMVYVASRFEPGRRRQNLSWSLHAELAACTPAEQDHWLDVAERERLSVRCLREERRRVDRAREGEQEALASEDDQTCCADESDELTCPRCGCRFTGEPDELEGEVQAQLAS